MSRPGCSGAENEAREIEVRSQRAKRGHEHRRANGFKPKPRPKTQRILSEPALRRRYGRLREKRGQRWNERAYTTRLREYTGITALVMAEGGSGAYTTNKQRARGLGNHEWARGPRTVQRAHRDLEEMGVICTAEDRPRGRCRDGRRRRGRLKVWLPPVLKTCHPPLRGAGASQSSAPARPKAEIPPASPAEIQGRAPPDRAAPPDGGRDRPPATPANGNCSDEREGPNVVAEDLTPTPEQESLFEAHFEQVRAEQERRRLQVVLRDRGGHGGRP